VGEARGFHSSLAEGRLTWWPEIGVGYYPVTAGIAPYDRDYFNHFARQADSDIGRALMQARCELVDRHYCGKLVDIGIGSGAFIQRRRWITYGYDVNPDGINWLQERNLWFDPYLASSEAMSLWDVLEHIPDFRPLLANVRRWLFIALPIFESAEHVLRSKHFKPTEHCWYFSHAGLIRVLGDLGFDLVEYTDIESALGREDIGNYVFRRTGTIKEEN
jgi:Methyltransferase domain